MVGRVSMVGLLWVWCCGRGSNVIGGLRSLLLKGVGHAVGRTRGNKATRGPVRRGWTNWQVRKDAVLCNHYHAMSFQGQARGM